MIYIIMNTHWETAWFDLPPLPSRNSWRVAVNTSVDPPNDHFPLGEEPQLPDQNNIMVGARSVVILVGAPIY